MYYALGILLIIVGVIFLDMRINKIFIYIIMAKRRISVKRSKKVKKSPSVKKAQI